MHIYTDIYSLLSWITLRVIVRYDGRPTVYNSASGFRIANYVELWISIIWRVVVATNW